MPLIDCMLVHNTSLESDEFWVHAYVWICVWLCANDVVN